MIIEVVGREFRRSVKDGEVREYTVLHCQHDPARKDKEAVTGKQVFTSSFFPGNGLKSDIDKIPVPCMLNADISRNKGYVNIDDFEVI